MGIEVLQFFNYISHIWKYREGEYYVNIKELD